VKTLGHDGETAEVEQPKRKRMRTRAGRSGDARMGPWATASSRPGAPRGLVVLDP
jgi:hypothetical protein